MSKNIEEIKPNYAPIYAAALYPDLAKVLVGYGYALAVHGSLARDFDLVAVPWSPILLKNPDEIVKEITTKFWIRQIGEPEVKAWNRIAYTLSVGHGECAIDLSFLPAIESTNPTEEM